MSKENNELVMLRLNYDIEKLKQFVYAVEQSEQEAGEIIAELKAENVKLKEKLEKIKEYSLSRMTGLACRHILSIIEGAEE